MRSLRFLAVTAVILSFAAIALASGQSYTTYSVRFAMGSVPDAGGEAHGTLTILPQFEGDDFQINIDSIVGLEYAGPRHYSWPGQVGDTFRVDLPFRIPNGKRSSVHVTISRGEHQKSRSLYFDLTGDRALIYTANPDSPGVYPVNYEQPPQRVYTNEELFGPTDTPTVEVVPAPNVKMKATAYPVGYESAPVITVIEDTTGLVEFNSARPDPFDSTWGVLMLDGKVVARMPKDLFFSYYVPEPPPKTERERMDRLEQAPLKHADAETFILGDTVFERQRGEYEFAPIAIVTFPPVNGHSVKTR